MSTQDHTGSSHKLADLLKSCQTRVNQALAKRLPDGAGVANEDLVAAMRYSLLSGGKRVRPVLAYASAQAIGSKLDPENIDAAACAIECIHAYSLIHDDLPAMDDDDLRRGQPTCHKVYSEASAILAGDALQTLAFECITRAINISAPTRLTLLEQLIEASGHRGMVMGQSIDLASVGQQVDLDHLQKMHRFKTGALIKAAVLMGAQATEQATAEQLTSLSRYADAIGLAFQVQDDILDVIADTQTLGKTQGADQARGKPTYVSLLGLQSAQAKAQALHHEALEALEAFDARADALRQLSAYIIGRSH